MLLLQGVDEGCQGFLRATSDPRITRPFGIKQRQPGKESWLPLTVQQQCARVLAGGMECPSSKPQQTHQRMFCLHQGHADPVPGVAYWWFLLRCRCRLELLPC